MVDTYKLDEDHRPVKVSLEEWALGSFEDRKVAFDVTKFFEVSTVFLGLDHRMIPGSGPPLLFETMVFERKSVVVEMFGRLERIKPAKDQLRYVSWDDALAGHKSILRRITRHEALGEKLKASPSGR